MIRVGLIGCGFMGSMHANVYSLLEGCELVAVADRKTEKAAKFAERFGVPGYETIAEMIANHEIDAIDICLPTYLHADATIEAAQAGKHVFCEKPMALTIEACDQMTEACRKAGVTLMIGHCIRFWPEYAYLKHLVESGRLGKLTSINLTRYGEFPTWSTDNWLANETLSGGGVLDMHIHDTDFVLYLLGEPKTTYSAGTIDTKGPSQVFSTFVYDGCIAHLQGGWNLPSHTPFKMAFRAIFEQGAAIMDGGPLTIFQNGREPEVPDFPKLEAEGGGNISDLGGYYVEIKYFIECLRQKALPTTVTPESSRLSVQTTLQEIRNMRTLLQS